jgi:hypothetical protein
MKTLAGATSWVFGSLSLVLAAVAMLTFPTSAAAQGSIPQPDPQCAGCNTGTASTCFCNDGTYNTQAQACFCPSPPYVYGTGPKCKKSGGVGPCDPGCACFGVQDRVTGTWYCRCYLSSP